MTKIYNKINENSKSFPNSYKVDKLLFQILSDWVWSTEQFEKWNLIWDKHYFDPFSILFHPQLNLDSLEKL